LHSEISHVNCTYMWEADKVFAFFPFVMDAVFSISESMNSSNALAIVCIKDTNG